MRISDWSSDVCFSDLLRLSGLAARDLDRVGDHEGRIEADAELADECHVLARVAAELFQERSGPRTGDRAEILDQIRSEARRVGQECVRTCTSRWSPYHEKQKQNKPNTLSIQLH